jgi:linoleoyl-CoA desaturase
MSVPTVRFNKQQQPEFFKELNKRVNQYFQRNNISKHANADMVFKTVFMLSLYFVPLILMLTGVVTSLWPIIGMFAIMGFGMAGIGLSVMHDANHGAYSKNKRVNQAVGFVLNFLGGFHVNWKIQHNVLHHSYTNIHGLDEDIDKGIFRMSPNQEVKPFYRFQAFYAPILYGFTDHFLVDR